MKVKNLAIIILAVLLVACDACDNCGITSREPTISLTFINLDSLNKLNDSFSVISIQNRSLDSALISLADTINKLNDRLAILTDLIANGGMFDAEKQLIESAISKFITEKVNSTEQKTINDSLKIVIGEAQSRINSGLVRVNEIQVVETGRSITYEDSSVIYALPLALDKSFVNYSINIAGKLNTLEVDYTIFEEVDVERNVLIRADNITIVTHSFDSLNACEENCLDGEASYTFYF